jgi:hypothetical protein
MKRPTVSPEREGEGRGGERGRLSTEAKKGCTRRIWYQKSAGNGGDAETRPYFVEGRVVDYLDISRK